MKKKRPMIADPNFKLAVHPPRRLSRQIRAAVTWLRAWRRSPHREGKHGYDHR
jgi:hypothetical protein